MATVTASYNWVSGETVTPTKLNTTAAPTVVVADNEVTTAKILDANVTNAKLASDIDASKLTTGTLPIARIADAAVTPAKLSQPLTLATAQNTTSGTSIDFTGIPSWAKRITVIFNQVSLSGSSSILVQIGSGSVQTSSYLSGSHGTNNSGITGTAGFVIVVATAPAEVVGTMQINNYGSNGWASSHQAYLVATTVSVVGGGTTGLSGALDRVRITTVNGTDTFDGGSINIAYEG
jgi:hypothetical protein